MNYTPNRILNVLSSSRNVREFYIVNSRSNSLVSKAITIARFEQQIVIVPNLKKASQIDRLLIMQKAAKSVQNISSVINVGSQFFAFLKNSDYLFSFFKELKREFVSIKDLVRSDTYANYDEHLSILEELLKLYLIMLKEAGFYDDISLPDEYQINYDFIKNYDEIKIKLDGIFSKLDWYILCEISKYVSVIIEFSSSKFNQKTIESISEICETSFEIGFDYVLNLSRKTVISKVKIEKNTDIKLKSFSIRSLQCAYVFDEISNFVRCGIDPKKIAVVLPDESFYEILKNADERNMLNYAMGKSFTTEPVFVLLNTLKSALDQDLVYEYDESYLSKNSSLDSLISALNYFKFDTDLYSNLNKIYNQSCDFDRFNSAISSIISKFTLSIEVKTILLNEAFLIGALLQNTSLRFGSLFEIFLMNLKEAKLSIVGGAEVTVMGVLESRSGNYDGVIIIDFNDDIVPKRSQKEMFLSSSVRKKAGLISHQDRENLQRFYYESLINSAKKVSISYLSDEESILSRFARDFSFRIDEKYTQNAYLNSLKSGGIKLSLEKKDIYLRHDFFATELSFSRLNTYLACKRKYYYRYILGIKEYRGFDKDISSHLGSTIHSALQEYFSKFKTKFVKKEFLELFKKYENTIDTLDSEIFKAGLAKFEESQNTHFNSGFSVFECEKELKNEFCGVKITGKIDRIDKSADTFMLIDYKSGTVPKKSFQLSFYEALFGHNSISFYYDIKNEYKFIPNDTNTDELAQCINGLKDEFKNEVCFDRNEKACQYCAYFVFCKKELK
ncbi:PD-(D/E)XK nuclease family protein [Campylobacter fetus]|uniref:PD-(D/E)XK endonuclease-like domain-containing protein n=2 Tax=Campylobacter fetus TaxID=196 RepID=A0RN04_CAMFF|nr:PD-(D/E)XK nuclease family protein [Campylobacter fetus]ABK83419.1 conserved hypothetical protein [Campylobacter fetus subsp. fetus 82-40]EAI3886434.1 Dna2/Cas4 domain-containing protein [Campylobacter fetus]EAI3915514.1 Dna2/Cas4 domain-containing protein [Campylobacter fetus]EAI3919149.1 Dna2/Cas4 domain-containing protein [Campylobacter fetus]EAI8858432.1 Dna2/Cas4 domain-containing protein [Campylobacter fetus]